MVGNQISNTVLRKNESRDGLSEKKLFAFIIENNPSEKKTPNRNNGLFLGYCVPTSSRVANAGGAAGGGQDGHGVCVAELQSVSFLHSVVTCQQSELHPLRETG